MATGKNFRSIFTEFERELVVELVKKNKHIIGKKETNKVLNAQKSSCWLSIEREFNAVSGVKKRSAKQLKQCYENMKKRMKAKAGSETFLTAGDENTSSGPALFESTIIELDPLNVPLRTNYDSEAGFVLPDNTFQGLKETAVEDVVELNSDQTDDDIKPTIAIDGSIILMPQNQPLSADKSTSTVPTKCTFYKQSMWRRKEPASAAKTSSAIEIYVAKEQYYKEKLNFEREEHKLRKQLLLEKIKFMQNLSASVEKHPEKSKFYISQALE